MIREFRFHGLPVAAPCQAFFLNFFFSFRYIYVYIHIYYIYNTHICICIYIIKWYILWYIYIYIIYCKNIITISNWKVQIEKNCLFFFEREMSRLLDWIEITPIHINQYRLPLHFPHRKKKDITCCGKRLSPSIHYLKPRKSYKV